MSRFILGPRRRVQLGVLGAVFLVLVLGVGQQADDVYATETEIILSYSDTEPNPASVLVLQPGVPRVVYVWAVGVADPSGVSAYQVEASFNGDKLNVFILQAETDWLLSTGRSLACPQTPQIDDGFISVSCNTLTPPGSYIPGPSCPSHCDGLLATIGFYPKTSATGATSVNLAAQGASNGTFLLTTPPDLEVEMLEPLTLGNALVFFKCGDVSGDGTVDLFNDIYSEVTRYGWDSTHPEWEDKYDMNNDGLIDLFNDIVGVVQQYGVNCTQV